MGPICTCVTFTITRLFFLITSKRSGIKEKIVKSWLSDWVTLFQTLMLTLQKEQSTSMNGLVDLGQFCSAILQIIPQFVLPNWEEFKKRGFKLAALSCDDVESHKGWIEDIKAYNKL